MALPRIDLPIYEIVLPVSKKKVSFRAYTAREEKILMIAKEAGDDNQIPVAIKQIIANCSGIMNSDLLCEADRDFIVVQLRSKVSGNTQELNFTCQKIGESGEVCKGAISIEVDLNTITVQEKVQPNIIQLTKSIGVEFIIPTIEIGMINDNREFASSVDKSIALKYACLVSIYDEHNVTNKEDITFTDFEDWLLDLPSAQYEMIEKHFESIPFLSTNVSAKCPKCGTKHDIVLKGLSDFFR